MALQPLPEGTKTCTDEITTEQLSLTMSICGGEKAGEVESSMKDSMVTSSLDASVTSTITSSISVAFMMNSSVAVSRDVFVGAIGFDNCSVIAKYILGE